MSLCRHYVRELRRSVLIETPDLEKSGSKRSSMVLDQFTDLNNGGPSILKGDEKTRDQSLSAFLRHETNNTHHSPQSSVGSQQSGQQGSIERPSHGERRPRASFVSNGLGHTSDSNSPAHTVARADIRASAEKILYTYLLPGSEREIILPQAILNDVINCIEEDGRDDPEVFDAAKDYTFQAMERDAFPGFLRSKALGNLVPPSLMARLVLGLLAMFGGFWAGFACIFLDKPKSLRCWVSWNRFTAGLHVLPDCLQIPAYPSVYDRCLCSRLPTVFHRSHHCPPWVQRVHFHEFRPNQRTLRSPFAEQTRLHGLVLHRSYRLRFNRAVYLCAWQGTLMPLILRRSENSRLISLQAFFSGGLSSGFSAAKGARRTGACDAGVFICHFFSTTTTSHILLKGSGRMMLSRFLLCSRSLAHLGIVLYAQPPRRHGFAFLQDIMPWRLVMDVHLLDLVL